MAGLNFELLKHVKKTNQYCQVHPDQKLLMLANHIPFCPRCVEEKRRHKNNGLVTIGALRSYKRGFYEVLKKIQLLMMRIYGKLALIITRSIAVQKQKLI